MNARQTTAYLNFVVKLKPQAADAVYPHGPKVSRAGREYLIAHAIKGFAGELKNRALNTRLARVQKRLVVRRAKSRHRFRWRRLVPDAPADSLAGPGA
jgi:hypothetical protein